MPEISPEESEPSILNIDEGDVSLYEQLSGENMFRKSENKDRFLLAMAIGFKNGIKKPLTKPHSGGYARTEYLKDLDRAMITAVAVYDQRTEDILLDKKRMYQIAEEYAHAGIELLSSDIHGTQFGSFWKHFEKEVIDAYDEIYRDEENEEDTPR